MRAPAIHSPVEDDIPESLSSSGIPSEDESSSWDGSQCETLPASKEQPVPTAEPFDMRRPSIDFSNSLNQWNHSDIIPRSEIMPHDRVEVELCAGTNVDPKDLYCLEESEVPVLSKSPSKHKAAQEAWTLRPKKPSSEKEKASEISSSSGRKHRSSRSSKFQDEQQQRRRSHRSSLMSAEEVAERKRRRRARKEQEEAERERREKERALQRKIEKAALKAAEDEARRLVRKREEKKMAAATAAASSRQRQRRRDGVGESFTRAGLLVRTSDDPRASGESFTRAGLLVRTSDDPLASGESARRHRRESHVGGGGGSTGSPLLQEIPTSVSASAGSGRGGERSSRRPHRSGRDGKRERATEQPVSTSRDGSERDGSEDTRPVRRDDGSSGGKVEESGEAPSCTVHHMCSRIFDTEQ